MKLTKQVLCLVLALLLLVGTVGCQTAPATTQSQNMEVPGTTTTAGETEPTYIIRPTSPSFTLPNVPSGTTPTQPDAPEKEPLVFELTQAHVDDYYLLLDECEQLALAGLDMDAIEAKFEELDELYNFLYAQNSIASVMYYANMKDETLKEQHLHTTNLCTDANDAYIQMTRRVYLSDTPAKETLFEGWSEQDIMFLMSYNEQVVQLNKRNAAIVVEYQNTKDETTRIELYKEMVINNNQIAQIYGYENYYFYASELVCRRDYSADEMALIRQYGRDYLADLYATALKTFRKNYNRLSSAKQKSVNAFLNNDYTSIRTDHIGNYLAVMPDTMETHIKQMIQQDSLFTKDTNAMGGAFTISVGERSYCFFGPGYASLATVIHEGGHYYASRYNKLNSIPLDLAETHSQANEWLFLAYLDGKFADNEYQCVLDYRLVNDLSTILVCLMVDEFEQQVYASDVANFTAKDFKDLMNGIVAEYFDPEYAATDFGDMNGYWPQVVVDHPVYYLSYAVSAITAMDLYTIAVEDFAGATEIYRKLCEEPVLEAGFLGNIRAAGLAGPFDENFYLELKKIIDGRA